MTDCVVCIRRDTDYTVCRGCRLRLSTDLTDLPDLHNLLPAVTHRIDQLGQRVAGTPEPPAPVNIDVLDLLAGARIGNPTLAARLHPEDLLGQPSVASVLDSWVRDWREVRDAGERLPDPHVHHLATWLHTRLDWACDHHPAVDEFAHEIHDLTTRLRNLLALKRRVEVLQGAACPTCDTRSLFRTLDPREGASDWIECGNCHRLWTDSEYDRLVTILAADNTRSVTT